RGQGGRRGRQGGRRRWEARLACDLCFRATLRFVRQIEIFKPRLRIGLGDRRCQLRRELSLLVDALQDDCTSFIQLAKIRQPLFECAQLRIVKTARRLFALSRDEGNDGFFVEQRNRRGHLRHPYIQLFSDTVGDGFHERVRRQQWSATLATTDRSRSVTRDGSDCSSSDTR